MFYQEYQLADALRPAGELDTYCRLEGLDALYIRSVLEKERKQKLTAFLGRIIRKRAQGNGECVTGKLLSEKS